MDKQKLLGALFVLLGAISYGILATIVKYANGLGIPISSLTFFQFFIGFVILVLIRIFSKPAMKPSLSSLVKLLAWGASLGVTTTLYYLSIQYIPVSVGIILLMQSIWISLLLEAIITKQMPAMKKTIGALLCIVGTLLATKIFGTAVTLDWRGVGLGIGAGLSYTISIYSSSSIEKQHPNYIRSLYLVAGGLIVISIFWNLKIIENISVPSLSWGALLALFGTVIPPLLFTVGIPKTGIGIGSILSAIEIPVSIFSAFIILQEQVTAMQWFGVLIIVFSVVVVNINPTKKPAKTL
ncbi:EamA family transporter [Sphingobacterium sp. Mn56C]|uniref:EamA family transporter n=1 Tax=Sphingobacterium sp. Mn56C TaxID=3395261 RepID=UPI003BEE4A88